MSSRIPEWHENPLIEGVALRTPGDATQFGCIWCRKEKIDGPVTSGIGYILNGNSVCGRHLDAAFENQGA